MSELNKLIELASKLPKGLNSDWEDSNHFELTSDEDYFWLCLIDGLRGVENPMDSIIGKRVGLLMDIAEEVGRLRDTGVFDKFLPKLSDLVGLFKTDPVDVAGHWDDPTDAEMEAFAKEVLSGDSLPDAMWVDADEASETREAE